MNGSSAQTTFSLRPAALTDLAAIVALRVSSLVEMGILETDTINQPLMDRLGEEFRSLLSSVQFVSSLAVDGDNIIGCAFGLLSNRLPYPISSVQGEVAGVYVVPNMRMRGVASQLVRSIVIELQAREVREIILRPRRAEALLYTRAGFRTAHLMKFSQ